MVFPESFGGYMMCTLPHQRILFLVSMPNFIIFYLNHQHPQQRLKHRKVNIREKKHNSCVECQRCGDIFYRRSTVKDAEHQIIVLQ